MEQHQHNYSTFEITPENSENDNNIVNDYSNYLLNNPIPISLPFKLYFSSAKRSFFLDVLDYKECLEEGKRFFYGLFQKDDAFVYDENDPLNYIFTLNYGTWGTLSFFARCASGSKEKKVQIQYQDLIKDKFISFHDERFFQFFPYSNPQNIFCKFPGWKLSRNCLPSMTKCDILQNNYIPLLFYGEKHCDSTLNYEVNIKYTKSFMQDANEWLDVENFRKSFEKQYSSPSSFPPSLATSSENISSSIQENENIDNNLSNVFSNIFDNNINNNFYERNNSYFWMLSNSAFPTEKELEEFFKEKKY